MKIIEVEYMPNGNYIENYDKPYVIDDESGVCVRATFPQGESGSVRAYIGGSGTGDVVDCGTVSVLARTAQVILTDDNLAQGLIIVGFEVNTGAAAIRYRPLKLKVNQFVDPTGSNPHGYTVTVSVGTVTSLPAGSAPTVENVGTGKDVVLNFGIPKGDKGDSADVVDNLTSTDTDKALSANQGKVLDGKKVDKADGKGLSSNDYTTAEKSKVANLPDDTNTELSKKADDTSLSAHKGASVLDHPDESVTTAKLGTSAVETDKLKDGAVTKTKIADGAVSESKFDSDLSAAFTGKENSRNKGQPNGYAPLDANGKLPDSYLYGVTVKQYGIRWKGTSSTVCERLGDAVGLTAKAHKGSTESVENDFDNIYPWSDIKTCNIDADGNVLAYLGEPSFARDGTNGDVMVEIPKFYYKRVKTGIVEEIWICGTKLPGYELHPLFIDNGKEVSKVFHSVYNASSFTDETDNKVKLQSITGVQPRVRTTRANFRTYARNKGAIWGIEDISCVNALQLLYLVEYANTNSQSALGSGADNLSYAANHKALEETTNGNTITIASTYKNTYKLGQRIEIGTSRGVNDKTTTPRTITAIATDDEAGQTTITFDGDPITIAVGNMLWNVAPLNGSCDALNGKSGWLAGENNYTDHLADVNYRGIEGFHAKLFRFIDGVNIKDRVVYYANSIADYADGVYDGKYRAVGYSNAEANGYVSAFGYDEKAPWVMFPSAAVGGSSTFVPDYYYQNTGERLLSLGGYWYDGTYAGAFCFICNLPSSYSYSYCGSHLLVKKP